MQFANDVTVTKASLNSLGARTSIAGSTANAAHFRNISGNNTLNITTAPPAFSAGGTGYFFDSQAGTLTINFPAGTNLSGGGAGKAFGFSGVGNFVLGAGIAEHLNGTVIAGNSVVKDGTGTAIVTGSIGYTGATTVNGGTLQLARLGAITALGSNTFTGTATVAAGGTLKLSAKPTAGDTTATSFFQSGSLVLAGTVAAPTGRLDITNNGVVLQGTTVADAESLVRAGFAAGAQTGQGIISSTAAGSPRTLVGVADSTDLGSPATFLGTAYTGQASFIRYTFAGDADLSGSVDSLDFNKFVSGYGQSGVNARFATGDFNYDSTVDTVDFAKLISNFGQVLPASAGLPAALAAPGAVVPEPASFALVGFAAAGLMTRRRTRK